MTRHYHPAHRRQAIQWARNLMAHTFYVLDTETTGLGNRDEIVQISIIDGAGAVRLDQLLKPTVPIGAGARAVHGISEADVATAPDFKRIYIQLSALLAAQTVVAYNMDFDARMLEQTARAFGLPPLRIGKSDCAMKQYAKYKGARKKNGRGYIFHKLSAAARQERLELAPSHDALGDARATLALIRKMAAAG